MVSFFSRSQFLDLLTLSCYKTKTTAVSVSINQLINQSINQSINGLYRSSTMTRVSSSISFFSFTILVCLFSYGFAWIQRVQPGSATGSRLSLARLSPDDLKGKLLHQKSFHRLTDDSDVSNPRALSIEERIVLKPNMERKRLEPYGTRVLIVRNEHNEEVIRFRVHESDRIKLQPSTIATVLYLACEEPELLFTERVLELSCELGIAGLLGALCVGKLSNPKKEITSTDDMNILPDKSKSAIPFPVALQSLTLSDSDPEALHLASMNIKQVSTDTHKINLQEFDWQHRPRITPGKNLYRGILASDLTYSFPQAKELARTVAYSLEPQLGRFLHTCSSTVDDVVHLRKFLSEGYLMRVDTRFVTLESHVYKQQILPDGEMPSKEFELGLVNTEIMQVVIATHHPEYDGVNGEYFFPMETGTFDKGFPEIYLEKEPRRSPWG